MFEGEGSARHGERDDEDGEALQVSVTAAFVAGRVEREPLIDPRLSTVQMSSAKMFAIWWFIRVSRTANNTV